MKISCCYVSNQQVSTHLEDFDEMVARGEQELKNNSKM